MRAPLFVFSTTNKIPIRLFVNDPAHLGLFISNYYFTKVVSIFSKSGGPRISKPTRIDVSAAINTAAAPTSLPTFANGCCCGLARSTTASKAVLMNSAVQTSAMVNSSAAQSLVDTWSHHAISKTSMEANACSHALCWVRTTYHKPRNAFLKACAREIKKFGGCLLINNVWRNAQDVKDL